MDQLIAIGDAAKLLDVDSRTLRRWIAEGRIPAVRIGPRLVKIRVSELEALIKPVPAATDGER